MIVVVADTSPLNYLIQIHCDHVLPALYERGLTDLQASDFRCRRGVLEEVRHRSKEST